VARCTLPADWRDYDALYLTATDPHDREIFTWSWMIPMPEQMRARLVTPRGRQATSAETESHFVLRSAGTTVWIDRATGLLSGVEDGGQAVSLSNGPRLVSGPDYTLTGVRRYRSNDTQVVEASFEGGLRHIRWTMHPGGWLELDYQFGLSGTHDFIGASFDYPEAQVEGVTWLGQGPYRVWKNRREGLRFDVHSKDYNDAMTGIVWEYPEFKGYHADLYWATLDTREAPVTVVTETPGLFLPLFTPRQPAEAGSRAPDDPTFTAVAFPEGDLSFLHGIPAIGTKFNPATATGPAGMPNRAQVHQEKLDYRPRLFFYFGRLSPEGVR
jgi:hypothetical protein